MNFLKQLFGAALALSACLVHAQQNVQELMSLAVSKSEAGEYKYAAAILDRAIELDSTELDLWMLRGAVESNMEDDSSTPLFYLKAIELDTTFAAAYNELALFYGNHGDFDKSNVQSRLAIRHSPNDTLRASYIMNMGAMRINLNDHEGAIEYFEEALEIFPNLEGALNNLAASYGEVGRDEDAIRAFRRLESVTNDPDIMLGVGINLGMTYTDLDSLDQAMYYYERAARVDPAHPLLLSNRAETLRKLGRYSEALADINASISSYPTNSFAYYNLAKIYLDQKMNKEACRALQFAMHHGFSITYGERAELLQLEHCAD